MSAITITFASGKARHFEVLDKHDRRTAAVSLMTVPEMTRFFAGSEAAEMAKQLGLSVTGKTEAAVCQAIYNFFHGS